MEFGPFLGALARGVQLDGGGGRMIWHWKEK